jgi:hypothetical protein
MPVSRGTRWISGKAGLGQMSLCPLGNGCGHPATWGCVRFYLGTLQVRESKAGKSDFRFLRTCNGTNQASGRQTGIWRRFREAPTLASWGDAMRCKSCTSENHRKFSSEVNVHFPGLKNLDKRSVFVFPKLLVCMDCGFAEFAVPETELLLLGKDAMASGTTTLPTPEWGSDLSEFVVGLPFSGGEIESSECAADKPLSLKNGFCRH